MVKRSVKKWEFVNVIMHSFHDRDNYSARPNCLPSQNSFVLTVIEMFGRVRHDGKENGQIFIRLSQGSIII